MNPITDPALACIDEAAEATRVARAIACDPACAPRSAAAPLAAAWRALAQAMPAERSSRLSPPQRDALPRELAAIQVESQRPPGVPSTFSLGRAQILAHAAELERTTSALRMHVTGRRSITSPWPRRLAIAVAVALLAALLARPWQSPSFGPWRGAYHSLPDFTGDVTVRHDLDLRFDWGRRPPLDQIPANKYSVRWDTCLTLDAARDVTFQLTTDNRARLFVDDRPLLRLAGKTLAARGSTVELAAGVHHLRVDYAKLGPESHIGLTASLDGEPPQALPMSRLSAPRETGDGQLTCD